MSIATRTGDLGTTGLMYNRRVRKDDDRVEAYGTVDELNAALGVARIAEPGLGEIREGLLQSQRDLVILMGELATLPEDRKRYLKDGFSLVTSEMTRRLDEGVAAFESRSIRFDGWATPGARPDSAALDVARTVCRRAERRICSLGNSDEDLNPEILVYLNRLSDWLWLAARWVETSG